MTIWPRFLNLISISLSTLYFVTKSGSHNGKPLFSLIIRDSNNNINKKQQQEQIQQQEQEQQQQQQQQQQRQQRQQQQQQQQQVKGTKKNINKIATL